MKEMMATRRGALLGSALLAGACATHAETPAPLPPEAGSPPPTIAVPPRPNTSFDAATIPDPAAVLAVLNYTAAAQMAALTPVISFPRADVIRQATASWVSATFYVGAARLGRVSDNVGVRRFLVSVGDQYNYAFRGARTGRGMVNADDLAIGDLYQEIYALRPQPGVLAPLRQRADFQVPHLTKTPAPERLVWWWCDALFMAPPVFARLSVQTGDPRYLEAMHVQWLRTHERLYDTAEKLYARDERFIERRAASGSKIFWSRGEGWVIGGLTRVLESMPADFHSRAFYVQTFREMCARLADLQGADGLWRASLIDPHAFPEPEASGSAFFIHGMAWGINHGLLDRATYLPHVLRGWAALSALIQPDGLLGYVQRTGDQPVPTRPGDHGQYGSGALLMAGLEVMRLNAPTAALPRPEPAPLADDAAFIFPSTEAPPQSEAEQTERTRRDAERAAVRALAYDSELGR